MFPSSSAPVASSESTSTTVPAKSGAQPLCLCVRTLAAPSQGHMGEDKEGSGNSRRHDPAGEHAASDRQCKLTKLLFKGFFAKKKFRKKTRCLFGNIVLDESCGKQSGIIMEGYCWEQKNTCLFFGSKKNRVFSREKTFPQ